MKDLKIKMLLTIYKNDEKVNTLKNEDANALIEFTKTLLQVHYIKRVYHGVSAKIESKYNDEEYLKITLKYRLNETTIYKYIYEFEGEDLKKIYDFHLYD